MNTITDRFYTAAELRKIARTVKQYRALKTRAGRQNAWNDATTQGNIAEELIKQFMQADLPRA
jgi:hypothetical protein